MKLVKLSVILVICAAFVCACGHEQQAAQPVKPVKTEKPAIKQNQHHSSVVKTATVKGIVRGEEFRVEQAILDNNTLTLRQGSDFFADRSIDIVLFGRKSLENRSVIVKPQTGLSSPHLRLGVRKKGEELPDEIMVMDGYEMKLAFGEATAMGIYFSIRLATKEIPRTDIEGDFFATFTNIRLKNGRFDPTFDSLDTLRHLSRKYLENKYRDIEILEDFNASYKSRDDAEYPKSGFIGFEVINKGVPLIVKLQLMKGRNGWRVGNQLDENQIDQAHPLQLSATADEHTLETVHARTAAASKLENELNMLALIQNVRSTDVGCYTSKALDRASCRAVYSLKTSGEVACMSKNYLLVRSNKNWMVEKEIADTEKVDYNSGQLVSYEPFHLTCT